MGLGTTFEILTIFLFGILGGYLIDSFNSKKVLIVSNILLVIITLLGFLLLFHYNSLIIFLLMIMFTIGIIRTNNLARTSIVFYIFEGEELKLANSLLSMLFTTALILGPVISILIYDQGNINGIFLAGTVIAIFSITMYSKIKDVSTINKKPLPFLKGMVEPINLIKKNRYLFGGIVFQLLLMGSCAVEASLFYVFTKEIVERDTSFFSLVIILQGIGQLIGSFLLPIFTKNKRSNLIVFQCTLIVFILESIYIIFPNSYLILISSFIVGICIQIIFILSSTVFLQYCSSKDVGRLNGFKNTITSLSSILFIGVFSLLLGYFSVVTVLLMNMLIMGISSIIGYLYIVDKK